MAPGSEKDFDDDPYCAHCGESVSVKADCEFNEGDLCNECLYVEYPKMKRERDHLESLLAVAVGGLRKLLAYSYPPAPEPGEWRDEVIADFCDDSGLSHEEFAALKLGEGE